MASLEELIEVYGNTVYSVEAEGGEVIELRIGQASARLDTLLQRYSAASWAFITAFNPGSVLLSHLENDRRHAKLVGYLQGTAYRFFAGQGTGEGGDWPAERSLLILDIEREAALAIGRDFGQVAIVYGFSGGVSELLLCL